MNISLLASDGFLSTAWDWFRSLWVDEQTLGNIFSWVDKLPTLFGDMHPVIGMIFGLFGIFLTVKIIIHLL